MKQNYFVINGNKYYTGTVFVTRHYNKQLEASFIYYDTDYHNYVYKMNGRTYVTNEKMFYDNFVSVTNKIDQNVNVPVVKKMKDTNISGMILGWMWYIFLMGLASILQGQIMWWALISVIFFTWRSNKIKKEGTYIEW